MAALERRNATDRDEDEARRRRAEALLRERGIDPAEVDWAVVPANSASPRPLDHDAAEAFRVHLRRLLDTARGAAETREGAIPSPSHEQTDETDEPALAERRAEALSAACAACRGWCCARGGVHAFLDDASLTRIRRSRPDLDSSDLLAVYEVFLGPTRLDGGCVFQGPTGCRLPRSLRSDTCNDWWCDDLERVRERWHEDGLDPRDTHFLPVLPSPSSPK
ncbi:MAG: hypothetical protein KJP18_16295 [Gemmatimonadetes bacterium]|nr:hypothetical protein [Gemmatimonadota bacterium]NNF37884.1 hypothetical protein [Gemmatimonadota bacterium]